jgi:hypothetical protein
MAVDAVFAGLATIAFSHTQFAGWREGVFVALGGTMIVIAHFLNSRYVGACSTSEAFLHLKHNHIHRNESA